MLKQQRRAQHHYVVNTTVGGCAERKELMEKKLVLVTWPYLEIGRKSVTVRYMVNAMFLSV